MTAVIGLKGPATLVIFKTGHIVIVSTQFTDMMSQNYARVKLTIQIRDFDYWREVHLAVW
jgi:uncharacterized protein (DUF983 family)